jgi:hypothetical protein
MIVSIPDTITHQKLERKLILTKTYGEVLNLKLKAIIARERLQLRQISNSNLNNVSTRITMALVPATTTKMALIQHRIDLSY